jgi:hypothetical protein
LEKAERKNTNGNANDDAPRGSKKGHVWIDLSDGDDNDRLLLAASWRYSVGWEAK